MNSPSGTPAGGSSSVPPSSSRPASPAARGSERTRARRPVKVLARAFGVRDLAIGLGVVIALDRGTPVRGWIEAGVLSDAIDTAASLLAGSSIPPAIRWPCVALGAGSAALGALARASARGAGADPGRDARGGAHRSPRTTLIV